MPVTPDPYPVRKPMNHTPPPAIRADDAWYFITICAAGHRPWVMMKPPPMVGSRVPRDRNPDRNPDTTHTPLCGDCNFDSIANSILSAARWYHEHGKWRLALFLVMPDHLHFIVHFPPNTPNPTDETLHNECGHAGRVTLPVQQFKSYLMRAHGIKFQRDFFDTRIRDDAHYGEKWRYIVSNPVTRGLCATPRDWPHVIAFDRETGTERPHR